MIYIMRKKRRHIIFACIAVFLVIVVVWTAWGNTALEQNTYTITGEDLPQSFDGYRIAHVSDLHNARMGDGNEKLLAILQDAQPDMIAITGDLIDSRNTDVEIALQFAEEAVKIAPCYFVTGNHENWASEYDDLKKGLTALGVVILEDERVELEQADETIILLGVNDPNFQTDYPLEDSETVMQSRLQELMKEDGGYTVLLSHRPELFEAYVESGVDLVLSGHAHGGQFRLPLVGGLVAPNQGLFPRYDAGLYTEANTNMIVNRGIGNSVLPFRFNNRPEVILVQLSK